MKHDRYQFFQTTAKKRMKQWEKKFILDRQTRTVYMPALDPAAMLAAAAVDELLEVDGHNYIPIGLYVELYPELRDGLLTFEQRIKAAA
jgi:hypothetical protein